MKYILSTKSKSFQNDFVMDCGDYFLEGIKYSILDIKCSIMDDAMIISKCIFIPCNNWNWLTFLVLI